MREKRYPSERADRFMLRFPDGLRDCVRDRADKNERSMNSEIIFLIKKGMESTSDQPTTA